MTTIERLIEAVYNASTYAEVLADRAEDCQHEADQMNRAATGWHRRADREVRGSYRARQFRSIANGLVQRAIENERVAKRSAAFSVETRWEATRLALELAEARLRQLRRDVPDDLGLCIRATEEARRRFSGSAEWARNAWTRCRDDVRDALGVEAVRAITSHGLLRGGLRPPRKVRH